MFSSTGFAGWTKIGSSGGGAITYYVDFERIRKVDGFVYVWMLTDLLKSTEYGDLSARTYIQGDCKLFRFKILSQIWHEQPMGRNTGKTTTPKNPEWRFPSPNSVNETILKSVCSR